MRLIILFFLIGVVCLQFSTHLPSPEFWWAISSLLGVCSLLLFVCRFCVGRSFEMAARVVLRAILALCLGFAWAGWRAELRLSVQLPSDWEGQDIEVVGVVAELPQMFSRGERFMFDVESVLTPGAIVPPRVMLSWYRPYMASNELATGLDVGKSQSIMAGERWRLTLRLKRPHAHANPHGFDYEAWLLERGVRATGYVRSSEQMTRLSAYVWQPMYIVERLRQLVRDRFLSSLPESTDVGVLVALAVGDQRAIQGSRWEVFRRTGTTHLMSISGLHVTMVAGFFGALVGFLWRRFTPLLLRFPAQKAAVVAAWLAALAYTMLSGFSVPAQRTLYMLSVAALALLNGRYTAPSRTLSLALFVVLLVDPWAVLAPGFWLSFVAVAVLFYVVGGRLRFSDSWWGVLRRWGLAQWAVTLGSAPLLLLFFQQISVVSPLANAVAIPLVSFVITPLALIAACLPLSILLSLDDFLLSVLMSLLEWLAVWPVFVRPEPPWPAVVLAVLGVVWLLLPRGFPARYLGGLMILPSLLMTVPRPLVGEAWVSVVDVGQGLAVLIRTATHNFLYDTGPRYSAESDAGQRIIVPYLRALGIKQLDGLMVTHRDADHSGGADSVKESLPVLQVWSSLPEWQKTLCVAGQKWVWDGVHFAVLYPYAEDYVLPGGKSDKPNHLSCVLRIEAGGQRLLLTSDIEATDEFRLLTRSAADLRSEILLVPHHGSRTSSSLNFVRAVAPDDVIYTVGYRNRFGHPKAEVMARYEHARVWRTDYDGAIDIRLGISSAVPTPISAYRRTHPRYWQQADFH